MKLIVQNGKFDPGITKYIDASECVIVKSFVHDLSTLNVNDYEMVIILGGHQSVLKLDEYSYLKGVLQLIEQCHACSIPLIGICLGAQLIAHYFQCEIVRQDKYIMDFETTLTIGEQSFDHLFRSHQDVIVPNDQLQVLSSMNDVPYLFRVGDHIIGIQCHPDVTPAWIMLYMHDKHIKQYAREHASELMQKNQMIINYLIASITK